MNKAERHAGIVKDLTVEPSLRVNELARRYDVSAETIRRDFNELNERGLISRTYGGATRSISNEPALSERRHLQVPEREIIARTAMSFIESNDVLMIGGGITTQAFAVSLALFKGPLTVITPSFGVAVSLGTCPNIKVQVLPGQYNGNEGLVQGPDTTQALTRFRATKAILGASGITADGPCDAEISAGLIYEAMSERSLQTYILADSSKFDKPALSCYSIWRPDMCLVTDAHPNHKLSEAISSVGTTIVLPTQEGDLGSDEGDG